jgi:hypothetical protein
VYTTYIMIDGRRRLLSFDVGLKHLAYADLSYDHSDGASLGRRAVRAIERWGVIDVTTYLPPPASSSTGKSKKAAVVKAEALTTALIEALDASFYDPGHVHYDVVLVENQPSRKNPAMKAVQVAILAYFATVRLHTGCVDEVRLISACRKLAEEDGSASPESTDDKKDAPPPMDYRRRKALSVELCRRALTDADGCLHDAEGATAALAKLAATKKKDDLADAMLQALAYLDGDKKTKNAKARKKTAVAVL